MPGRVLFHLALGAVLGGTGVWAWLRSGDEASARRAREGGHGAEGGPSGDQGADPGARGGAGAGGAGGRGGDDPAAAGDARGGVRIVKPAASRAAEHAAEAVITLATGLELAARVWGPLDAPGRVLALHGWLDNAATWDLVAVSAARARQRLHFVSL